jgi:HD-GYP domain-containing protein (c-di-GMP phosphodiesterase class II)
VGLFAWLVAFPEDDPTLMWRPFHFWAVSGIALFSALACAVLVASGRTLRETRMLFLALAFLAIAGIFSVHGLMTPGHIAHEFHQSVSASSWFSVAAGAILVALSAMETPKGVDAFIRRAGGAIFAWVAIAVGAYVVMSIAVDSWLEQTPTENQNVQYVIAFGAFALYAFALVRYLEAYRFAKLPSQAAMVVALALLCQVPPILLWGTPWHLSWWIYHGLYLLAFAVLFAGWTIEARRAGSLKVIAEGLSMRDALAQLNRGHDSQMLELVDAIEAKDVATLGHVRRVSAYALAIGKKLGLHGQELRSLVLAAELHDVGKIGVPDHILAKPGKLNDEETAEMRRHAIRGYEIAERVPALRALAPVIRAHHERIGGTGYPDALTGEQIPLLARIIAVADSYDAMTSSRPYRDAMARAEAIGELRRVRGRELDARCVDAFLAWLDEEGRQAEAA